MVKNEQYYKNLRNIFLPENLKVVFVLESPPMNGQYFYDSTGSKGELLFRIMMKFINYSPMDKLDGLKQFQSKGYFLIDSTYNQIDKVKNPIDRNRVIVKNIPELIDDIEKTVTDKRTKIIPIKKNICKILAGPLEAIGFKVLNDDLPFPDPSQQEVFFNKLDLLKRQYNLP